MCYSLKQLNVINVTKLFRYLKTCNKSLGNCLYYNVKSLSPLSLSTYSSSLEFPSIQYPACSMGTRTGLHIQGAVSPERMALLLMSYTSGSLIWIEALYWLFWQANLECFACFKSMQMVTWDLFSPAWSSVVYHICCMYGYCFWVPKKHSLTFFKVEWYLPLLTIG